MKTSDPWPRSNLDKRLLYHCFPRLSQIEKEQLGPASKRFEEDTYRQLSLVTLRSILRYGLFLFPEPFVRARRSDSRRSPQIRACFTFTERDDLENPYNEANESHYDLFGDLAIGLGVPAGRLFGALPCGYYGTALFDGGSIAARRLFEEAGLQQQSWIESLSEIKDVLRVLSLLEARSRPEVSPDVAKNIPTQAQLDAYGINVENLPQEEVHGFMERIAGVASKDASQALDFFDFEREPMFQLLGKIEMLVSLYQNMDAPNRAISLHYYDQNEWRIFRHSNASSIITCLDSSYDPFGVRSVNEKVLALAARKELITIQRLRHPRSRVDTLDFRHIWVLWGFCLRGSAQHLENEVYEFVEFIQEIVCPQSWVPEVQRALDREWARKPRRLSKPKVVWRRCC